ncbi:hypothetical protein Csa_023103 [Cucumis sativus]|uniref:Uncharacterized protein n=1 Tax=Cucumis sativus TaxID=3659 RepID=A0A0A0KMM2_CUCSA|nr:hypothetical protein Csa_023103 [Cucumis sativus]
MKTRTETQFGEDQGAVSLKIERFAVDGVGNEEDEEVGWRLSSMEVHRRRSPNVGGGDSQKPLDLPRR